MKKQFVVAITASVMLFASFTAVNAAPDETKFENKPSYTDVKGGDDYFDAIELLTALDIVDGYGGELGKNFSPNQYLSRAEFTKLVITALGDEATELAKSKEGSHTDFSDVNYNYWASGYIGAAASITEKGLINGMGDGTFKPEDKITYAQATKILTTMAGYGQWAEDKGGWTEGYLYWGHQIKIGEGINDIADDAEITRGQAAQMIKNAITAPIVIDTHNYSYDAFGNRYAQLEQKDGEGEDFCSLLTDKHDVYQVKGYMDGENVFVITSSANFAGDSYKDSEKRIDIHTRYKKENSGINVTAFIKSVNGVNTLLYMY